MGAGGVVGGCTMFVSHRIVKRNEGNKVHYTSSQAPGRVSIPEIEMLSPPNPFPSPS